MHGIAGGRLSTRPVPKRLVVDVREFMSSLPSVLHQQGLQIVPVTLEVSCSLAAAQFSLHIPTPLILVNARTFCVQLLHSCLQHQIWRCMPNPGNCTRSAMEHEFCINGLFWLISCLR